MEASFFCDRGGIYLIIFSQLFFSFFKKKLCSYYLIFFFFCASALACGSGLESKADIRTFKMNCLLDKPARSKDFQNICDPQKRLQSSHGRNLQLCLALPVPHRDQMFCSVLFQNLEDNFFFFLVLKGFPLSLREGKPCSPTKMLAFLTSKKNKKQKKEKQI